MTEQEKSEDEPRDPRWNKLFDNMTKTQGYKKLWNYFIQITETKPFKEKIARLREKYNIPVSGFKLTKHTWIPPEEWQHKHTEVERQLNDEIEKICEEYGLHFLYWTDSIKELLFFNKVEPYSNEGDMCLFVDLKVEREEPFLKEIQDADDVAFPIAIRISPYASQRDIVDFVKKRAFQISQWQEHYLKQSADFGINKVKSRKEKTRERNTFIYENRHKFPKIISGLVAEKFHEFLDYAYISKIIRMEKKRRKEV